MSSLPEIKEISFKGRIYTLVCMNTLSPGGGNKIHRFLKEIHRKKQVDTIVALSDTGSHTFHTLVTLKENLPELKNTQLLFLEIRGRHDPYSRSLEKKYKNNTSVKVISGSLLTLLPLFFLKKIIHKPSTLILGIGGHIQDARNVYENQLIHCLNQLPREAEVYHVLPVSSGNLLDSFLYTEKHWKLKNQNFIGVTTGPPLSRRLLKLKYRGRDNVTLKAPLKMSYNDFLIKAREFHLHSEIWLDPVHTIHLTEAVENLPPKAHIVLWITTPEIQSLPPD